MIPAEVVSLHEPCYRTNLMDRGEDCEDSAAPVQYGLGDILTIIEFDVARLEEGLYFFAGEQLLHFLKRYEITLLEIFDLKCIQFLTDAK